MSKRVLMLSTVAPTIGQFNVNNINILKSLGYEVHVAADFTDVSVWPIEKTERFKEKMEVEGVKCFQIDFSRSMFKLGKHIKAYKQLKDLMKENQYAFIHTHTPIASVIGRLVAHSLGTKVIYTAHGFHFYDGAPLRNWLIFYPIEKWLSKYTDVLITINKEDYKRASERFHAKETVYVPGVGIDTEKFAPSPNRRDRIRSELGLKDDQIMLLSVGELNENKNHEAVIKVLGYSGSSASSDSLYDSFSPLANKYQCVYVIVGSGILASHLQKLRKQYNVDVRLVGYRNDVADFYDAADVFILPSLREGLNVSLMEAMASKLACCVSRIRGNTDLIDEEKGGYLFSPRSYREIGRGIEMTIKNRIEEGKYNLSKIKFFEKETIKKAMLKIYLNIIP